MTQTQNRAIIRAGLAALLLSFAAMPAFAGQCPAGQMRADATKPVTTPAKGVTDTVIGAIDLAKEPAAIQGRMLRLRRLVIQPGGVVPWHSHHDRPAIIYTLSGQITEYASNCAVPILHEAGDSTMEMSGTSHWWKNNSKYATVLLSADFFPVETDKHVM